ncbi:MAG: hypothetical protein AB1390_02110 [Nitrospirota bacterium]
MERDKTLERIKSCMVMESACSTVYHLMAIKFPGENELWNELAFDEERHADIISEAIGFELEDYLNFKIPPELVHIRKTVDYAGEIKEMMLHKNISPQEALIKVKNLCELKDESYILDLLEKETEERVKKVFKKFFEIDRPKADLVRAVMAKYGL